MNRIPPLEFLSGTPKEAKTKKERGSPESQGKAVDPSTEGTDLSAMICLKGMIFHH